MSGDTVPVGARPLETGADGPVSLADRALAMLDAHWQPRGFTVPNGSVYPHQWLWDSCFHAIVWAHLGRGDRAVQELGNVFARQHADGFVPHMTYWDQPELHAEFWGRSGESAITQPPMYGHAVSELLRLGVPVDEEVIERAVSGLAFLLGPRRGDRALVPILHPWESGCDDSPRWDRWAGPERTPVTWRARKGDLVATIECSPSGSALANPSFEVESAAFNALVAFNVRELIDVGFGASLSADVDALVDELDRRWDASASTWLDGVDDGDGGIDGHGPARTLEALLPVLVTRDAARAAAVLGQVLDDQAFGGACGPAQVHRADPAFDAVAYWRGPAWPQLTYLFWLAATRRGAGAAGELAARLVRGAERSGFAEYWHPDTGAGLGAVPQSWAALATVVARDG
jgi:hypothetical protein